MKQVLFTTLLLLSFTFTYSQSKKASKFMKQYLEVAYGNGQSSEHLLKWQNREVIKYRILGDFQFISQKEWQAFLEDVSELTNMKFEPSQDTNYDVLIFFGSIENYADIVNYDDIPVNTFTKYKTWNNQSSDNLHQLTKSSFCINPNQIMNPQEGTFYLKKMFLKSLGLNGTVKSDFSILSNQFSETNTKLGRLEKRLLKLHYDQQIVAGMNTNQLSEVLLGNFDLEYYAVTKF